MGNERKKITSSVDRINSIIMEYDLYRCGAVVDASSVVEITAYLWCNNMDLSLLSYAFNSRIED